MVEFQQGLLITAIGMGLVFAVIIFLWGLMALMMRVTSRESQVEDQSGDNPLSEVADEPGVKTAERKKRAAAAAAAVGMAMARRQPKTSDMKLGDKKGVLSPWQTVHRLRQIEKRKRLG